MKDNLNLKRFFMETYDEEGLYSKYLNKEFSLDKPLYLKWLKEKETQNMMFAQSMASFNRIVPNSHIVESSTGKELSIFKYLPIKSEIHLSSFVFSPSLIKKSALGNGTEHYVCNGYFENTLEEIYNILEKGAFTVGICSDSHTKLYREIVEHYKKLREFLLKEGYITSAVETNCNFKNHVYLLMYDHKTRRR